MLAGSEKRSALLSDAACMQGKLYPCLPRRCCADQHDRTAVRRARLIWDRALWQKEEGRNAAPPSTELLGHPHPRHEQLCNPHSTMSCVSAVTQPHMQPQPPLEALSTYATTGCHWPDLRRRCTGACHCHETNPDTSLYAASIPAHPPPRARAFTSTHPLPALVRCRAAGAAAHSRHKPHAR